FPLSMIQAQRQMEAEEEPSPLMLISTDAEIDAAADSLLKHYGGKSDLDPKRAPAITATCIRRFDSDQNGRWSRDEVKQYLRDCEPDVVLSVVLDRRRITIEKGDHTGQLWPVIDLAGVPVELRAIS